MGPTRLTGCWKPMTNFLGGLGLGECKLLTCLSKPHRLLLDFLDLTASCWFLSYSAILCSRAGSPHSHVVLHEWLAFIASKLIHRNEWGKQFTCIQTADVKHRPFHSLRDSQSCCRALATSSKYSQEVVHIKTHSYCTVKQCKESQWTMNVQSARPKHLHFSSAQTTASNNIIKWISFHKACQSPNSCSHGIVSVKKCFVCFWCWWEVFSCRTAKVTTVVYNKMWNVFRMLLFLTLRNPPKSMDWGQKSRQALHCAAPSLCFISVSSRPDTRPDHDTKQCDAPLRTPPPPPNFRYYSSHPTPFQTLSPTSNTFSDIIPFYQRLLTYWIV